MSSPRHARIMSLVRPELPSLVLGSACLALSAGVGLALPQGIRWAVDRAASAEPILTPEVMGAALALLLVQAGAGALRTWLFTLSGERIVMGLKEMLFGHLVRQDMAFFDRQRTGELVSRLSSDAAALQYALTVDVSHGLRHLVSALGGIAMMVAMSPRLAGSIAVLLPIVGIGTAAYGRVLRRFSRQVQDADADATARAEELLGSIRTVRTFAREPWAMSRYGEALRHTYAVAARRAAVAGSFVAVSSLGRLVAIGLMVGLGVQEVGAGRMSLGAFSAFVVYASFVAVSIGGLTGLWGEFMKAAGASERVFELLERRPTIETSGGVRPAAVTGSLVLDGVTFAYPTRPDAPALTDVTVRVNPGERVAVVGPSGSGKSTVAALVSRLYDPDAGGLVFDGIPMEHLDPDWLRANVGVVSQQPTLFSGTIRDNILLGKPDATTEEIEDAARAANAHDFIQRLPQGYDTPVGERGQQLSGGQRQRIAIARAVLEDPRFLILDEATSALDTASEQAVRRALIKLMEGRTTLVITHRLDAIRNADRIVVLDEGRVVEEGAHEELMFAGGTYASLLLAGDKPARGWSALPLVQATA